MNLAAFCSDLRIPLFAAALLVACSQAPEPRGEPDDDPEASDADESATGEDDDDAPVDLDRPDTKHQPDARATVRDAAALANDARVDASVSASRDALAPAPRSDASASEPGPSEAAPDLFGDGGLLAPKLPGPPSPDNPPECPPVAPDNPIGPCLGVPVYATCTYGSYVCLCDWVHWLCI